MCSVLASFRNNWLLNEKDTLILHKAAGAEPVSVAGDYFILAAVA